jgi:hypothetical protein
VETKKKTCKKFFFFGTQKPNPRNKGKSKTQENPRKKPTKNKNVASQKTKNQHTHAHACGHCLGNMPLQHHREPSRMFKQYVTPTRCKNQNKKKKLVKF